MNPRRGLLQALWAGLCWHSTQAWPQWTSEPDLLRPYVGTQGVQKDRIRLELPRLADNGFVVPLKVSWMGAPAQAVQQLVLLSNRNPRPLIARFAFGPASAATSMSTRVRLNGSQTVYALAQWSDGSSFMDHQEVEVTESACLDQT